MSKNDNLVAELSKCDSEREEMQSKLTILEEEQDAASSTKDGLDVQIEEFEGLYDQTRRGKVVFDPLGSNNKHGILVEPDGQRKRIRLSTGDEVADTTGNTAPYRGSNREDSDETNLSCPKIPSSEVVTEAKLAELKKERSNARHRYQEAREQLRALKDHIINLEKVQNKIKATLTMQCIRSKNEYSKDAVRNDYAGESLRGPNDSHVLIHFKLV